VKKGVLLLILWLILLSITLPLAVKTPSLLIYSDSPFLSNNLQSVRAQNILMKYFNIGDEDYLYVIVNGTYNYSIDEIYRYIYLLNDSTITTPFNYSKKLENEYLSYLGVNKSIINNEDNLFTAIYRNLTRLKLFYIAHFQYFEYELNVTFWLPLHNFSDNFCPEYRINFDKTNGSLLDRARYAGYLTFRNPFLFYFGFNNYTNYTLAFQFLIKLNNYSTIIHYLNLSSTLSNLTYPRDIAFVNNLLNKTQNVTNYFHKGDYWLFIIEVPSNESLTAINQFIKSLNNSYVVGHLAYYAQSAYYTQNDIEIIDITTVILVVILLILLIRSFVPILILVSTAGVGLVLTYAVMFLATLFGYKIYYISGLVAPPIVFGLSIDYGILFIYRYFEELANKSLDPITKSFRMSTKGILISGISIVLGFSSFMFSPSDLLRNIGVALVISAVSSLIPAVFFTYTLLLVISPRFLSFPRKEIPSPNDIRQKYLSYLSKLSIKHNKIIVFILILSITILTFYYTSYVHTNVNINEIIPSSANSLIGTRILENMYDYSVDYVLIHGNFSKEYPLIYNMTNNLISQGNLVYGPISLGTTIITNNTHLQSEFYKDNYTLLVVYLKYPVFSKQAINITSQLIKEGFLVGGSNAQRIDIVNNTVKTYFSFTLPFTIILIIVYLFLILGSIILPLRLALTIGLSSLFGVFALSLVYSSTYWLSPLIVFALLFSLGIDYDMFIVIRLLEEMKEHDFDDAIVKAVESTGLVITACGLILAGAFFSLIVSDIRFLNEIGFGVGISILFDTFIVRPFLVPSILSVLKKYNFWPFKSKRFLYT